MSLKRIVLLLLVILLSCEVAVIELFYLRKLPKASVEQENPLPEDIRKFLSQPLSFIGMGSQCMVFSSEDSPYVLKVCKAHRYQLPRLLDNPIVSWLFPSRIAQKKEHKNLRQEQDFLSYTLAYEHLFPQTNILYLHLHKTEHLHQKIHIRGPLRFPLLFNADELVFYIQNKASTLSDYLITLSQGNKRKELQSFFQKLDDFLLDSYKKGLWIKDTHFQKNIGVCNGAPLWIDPGKVREDPSLFSDAKKQERFIRFHRKLHRFLSSLDPQLEAFASQEPDGVL